MQIDYRAHIDAQTAQPHIGLRIFPSKIPGNEIVLRPGINTITDEQWDELKEQHGVKAMLTSGQMRVFESPSIAKIPVYEALDLVQRTTEIAVLRRWADQLEPHRDAPMWKQVVTALETQIAEASTDIHGKPAEQREIRLAAPV